jgi:hypothetical protein
MPARSTDQLLADACQDLRRPRPLSALLTGEAVAQVDAGAKTPKTNGGRWRLNAGSEMQTMVWGVNMGRDGYPEPIRCIIDLAAATFEAGVVPALFAHSSYALIGRWSDLSASDEGIDGDLTLYLSKDAAEAAALPDALKVKVCMDHDHPWQASVGAYPADGVDGYERIDEDDEIELNGRTYSGAGELPLYVMRNACIFESSVVLWGADGNTGRIAAALLDPVTHLRAARAAASKEPSMATPAPVAAARGPSHLKTLLAANKGYETVVSAAFADDKSDAEIAALVSGAKDARIAELEAAAAKPATVPAKAALEAREAAAPPASAAAATVNTGSVELSWSDARREVAGETKLKGMALNAATLAKYPHLEEASKGAFAVNAGAGRPGQVSAAKSLRIGVAH